MKERVLLLCATFGKAVLLVCVGLFGCLMSIEIYFQAPKSSKTTIKS